MTLAPTERRAERVEAEDLLDSYLIAQKARKNLSDYTPRNYETDPRQFLYDQHDGSRALPTLRRLPARADRGLAGGWWAAGVVRRRTRWVSGGSTPATFRT